ncbi:TIGR03773 family transporter-associated surface protein [Schaalia vaccimaxillae]|uniref:TIGR03773 family transporter-associated surface protein n=1 Tax=Schaalia vaccimaxillae TaxID=183916 RepID=UPI0003B77B0E|nr:TIGR03773 family transporter-associated surface protein [Schaalia vaccimaxillae]
MSIPARTPLGASLPARLIAVLITCMVAVAGLIPAAPQAAAATSKTVISNGKVTLFNLKITQDESASTIVETLHNGQNIDLTNTVFGVTDAAKNDKPHADLNLDSGYVVGPTTASASELSLGWDITGITKNIGNYSRYSNADIQLSYTGPANGNIYVHRTDEQGEAVSILDTGAFKIQPGSQDDGKRRMNDEIELFDPLVGEPTWTFTQPGIYHVYASVILSRGSIFSSRVNREIIFAVGQDAINRAQAGETSEPTVPGDDETDTPSNDEEIAEDNSAAPPVNEDGDNPGDSDVEEAPSLDVEKEYRVGDNVELWAEGFSEGVTVSFLLRQNGTDIEMTSAVVDGGVAAKDYEIPESVKPGKYLMVARNGSLFVEREVTILSASGEPGEEEPAPVDDSTDDPADENDPSDDVSDQPTPKPNDSDIPQPDAKAAVESACRKDKPEGAHQKDPKTGRDLIYRTHVDAAHISWDEKQKNFAIEVVDGPMTNLRPADDVAIRLGPDADDFGREVSRLKIPADGSLSFLGKPGDIVWNAPGQYYKGHRPVWAGYGAGEVPSTVDGNSLMLEFVGSEGPGEVSVWRSGGGFITEDFHSGNPDKKFSPLVPGGHGHINWSFTKPGRYWLSFRGVAKEKKTGKEIIGKTYKVLWLVGEDKDVDLPKCTTAGAEIMTSAEAQDIGEAPADGGNAVISDHEADLPEAGTYVCADPGHFDLSVKNDEKGNFEAFLRDDSKLPSKNRPSYSVVVPVADSASSQLSFSGKKGALSVLGKEGTKIWTLPQDASSTHPYLGFNTQSMNYANIEDGVSILGEEFEGPGTMVFWDYDAVMGAKAHMTLKPGAGVHMEVGSPFNYAEKITFDESAHRHYAISFNKAGFYRVRHAFKVEYKPEAGWGERNYTDYEIYYAVGDEAITKACAPERVKKEAGNPVTPKPVDPAPVNPDQPVDPQPEDPKPVDPDQPVKPEPGDSDDPVEPEKPDTDADKPGKEDSDKPGTDKPSASVTLCEDMEKAPASVNFTMDYGHTDLFNLISDADGKLSLKLKEDVTKVGTLRSPEETLIKVKSSTMMDIPASIREAVAGLPAQGYVIDQSGNSQSSVVWPGWDTFGIREGGYHTATFDVTYAGPDGGRIFGFENGNLGAGFNSVLSDGSFEFKPEGSTIVQEFPAHRHINWVFTKAGRYVLTVTGHAASKDGAKKADAEARTYIIDVADRASCTDALSVTAAPDTVEQGGTVTFTARGLEAGEKTVFQVHSKVVELDSVTADEYGKAVAQWTVPTDFAAGAHTVTIKGHEGVSAPLTVTAKVVPVDKPEPSIPDPDNGSAGSGDSAGGNTGAGSGSAGSVAKEQCIATTITREATEDEAKKLSESSASTGAGEANTATTTLNFSVGPQASGNVSEGHFDLGPAIDNGTLVARIKDDRNQPASWVDPGSLTFALGDKAKLKAPKDLSFVATPGSDVWMIQQSQQAGVPWLGMNSQREEIVNGTKGGVAFTLTDVKGPGKVAVFESGSLGNAVGTHVFDRVGSTYTLARNTHAHQNWLFTEPGFYTLTISMKVTPKSGELKGSVSSGGASAPGALVPTGETGPSGRPMVKEVVGRTPSGAECVLTDADLARTGSSASSMLALSGLLMLGGAAAVAISRRRKSVQVGDLLGV